MPTHKVLFWLGHCGAQQNVYKIFTGSQEECKDHIASLPTIPVERVCRHCGGYTGTTRVQEQCDIREINQ